MALHNRAFGNTVVHSENGRFVVMITAAFSALPAITWNSISAPASARATYPISSITNSSYRVQRAVTRLSSLLCLASTSSLTISAAVVKRTRFRCRQVLRALEVELLQGLHFGKVRFLNAARHRVLFPLFDFRRQ